MDKLFDGDWNFLLTNRASKIFELENFTENLDFIFEESIKVSVTNIDEKIEEISKQTDNLNTQLKELEKNGVIIVDDEKPSDELMDIYNELGGLDYEEWYSQQQKISLIEMQVINLYKNFELLLKDIIVCAFPKAKKRDLFQWDNVKDLMKANEVRFGELTSYNYINHLRLVNNNIKHSPVIERDDTQIRSIIEFKNLEEFDYISLNTFYSRIKPYVKLFLEELVKEIIQSLYTFDDDRINKIICDYEERMDEKTFKKFSEAITSKLNDKYKTI